MSRLPLEGYARVMLEGCACVILEGCARVILWHCLHRVRGRPPPPQVHSVTQLQQEHGPFHAVVVAAGAAAGTLADAPFKSLPMRLCQVGRVLWSCSAAQRAQPLVWGAAQWRRRTIAPPCLMCCACPRPQSHLGVQGHSCCCCCCCNYLAHELLCVAAALADACALPLLWSRYLALAGTCILPLLERAPHSYSSKRPSLLVPAGAWAHLRA